MLVCMIFVVVLGIFFGQHYWNKREFYQMLAKYPSPKGFPIFGNTFSILGSSVDYIKRIDRWAEELEFPFCLWVLNRPTIISARVQDVSTVFNHPGALNRGGIVTKLGRPLFGNSLFIADYKEWKPRRKIIAATFSPKILEGFFLIFRKNCDMLSKKLEYEAEKGSLFDLNDYIPATTFNTICGTAMGTDLAETEDSSNFYKSYIQAINDFLKISALRALNFYQQIDCIYNFTAYKRKLDEAIEIAHHFSKRIIKDRKKLYETYRLNPDKGAQFYGKNSDRKVFIDYLIEVSQKDSGFKEDQIRGEVDTFTVAGYETTAITTCFALLLLGEHQEIQQKVYEELLHVIPDDNHPIEIADLDHMDYLDRFLKEVLRKWGPAAVMSRSVVTDVKLDDTYTIPKGANFIFWLRRLHLNPEIWPNPEKFDPDRFLPEEVAKRPNNSYLPFSIGSRNCIGMKYAQIFLKTLVATIVRKYHITSPMEERQIEIEYAFTIRSRDGYWVRLEKRKI